jgi:RNA polymerase subunit RPABC4/transcription elongation factor Spt4
MLSRIRVKQPTGTTACRVCKKIISANKFLCFACKTEAESLGVSETVVKKSCEGEA